MAEMNLRGIFSIVDRMSAPVRKITGVTSGLGRTFEKVGAISRGMGARVSKAREEFQRLDQENRKVASSTGMVGRAIASVTALLGGLSVAALGKNIFTVSAQFESYLASLETSLGSIDKARAASVWVQKFAKETPYELAQVMESFIKLQAYGIDPQARALRTLGDAASGMQKSLDQAVEALADAQTGEFERLKEFGIRSAQQGNKVTFTYMKAGKTISVVAKKNAADIQKALLDVFDARFAGAMAKQSTTWNGLMSNLGDWVQGVQKLIGDKGVFAYGKSRLAAFMAQLEALSKNGKVDGWAQQVSDAMIELFKALEALVMSIDWVGFIKFLTAVANGLNGFLQAIGGLKGLLDLAFVAVIIKIGFAIAGLVPPIVGAAAALWGLTLPLAPIYLIIAAVTALAVGAFLLFRNWDKVGAWFAKMWEGLKGIFKTGADAVFSILPPWFQAVLRGAAFVVKFATGNPDSKGPTAPPPGNAPPRPPRLAVGRAARNQSTVGGEVNVNIGQDGRARVQSVKSSNPNVPVKANTGLQGAL